MIFYIGCSNSMSLMSTTACDEATRIQTLVMIEISAYSPIWLKTEKSFKKLSPNKIKSFLMSAFHLNSAWEIVATENC